MLHFTWLFFKSAWFACFFSARILILNTDTSVFSAYWYSFSTFQIEYWLVYDQNLVSVLATETKIRCRYRYRSLNFFYLNQNFLYFLFLMLFAPCFEYFRGHTELSCKTFFNYLSNFHWLVCTSELLTQNVLVVDMT